MKDLRFKIIADFVKGGFDKAESAVGNLKAKFAGFFSFSSVSWARIGTAATAGIALMMKAGDALKNHFIGVFREMEQSRIGFGQNMDSWLRKGGKMQTQNEKDRLIEDVRHEIQNMTAKRDEMIFEDSLDSRKDKALEELERQKNMLAGRGDFSDDELRVKRLDEQIFRAKKLLETFEKIDVKTPGQEFQEREDARSQERTLEGVSMKEREDMLARRLASAEEKMAKARDALNRSPKNADLAEAANKQLDVVEKLESAYKAAKKAREDFESDINTPPPAPAEKEPKRDPMPGLVESVNEVRRDIARENATPEERRAMDAARFRDIRKQVNAKNADGGFALPPEERAELIKEGLRLQASLRGTVATHATRSAVQDAASDEGLTSRMSGRLARGGVRGGLRWRAGAMASEAAGTPGPADDPQLREAKETNRLLKNIEKKTGAAP